MTSQTIKKGLVAVVTSMLVVFGASASMAAAKVTVDLPNAAVAGGESVDVPFTLTGFNIAQLNVVLTVAEGTLTVEDPSTLLTLNAGYSSLVDQNEISFHGAKADVISILATGVKWTSPGDAATSTELQLRAEIGAYEAGTSYDPTTGHSYKYVSTEITFQAALAAAKLMTYKGKSGYLTSITTASENDFVANKTGAQNIWIGTTADMTLVNAALTAAGKPTISVDPQPTGTHYWTGGAEQGVNYSTGLGTVTPVGGMYNSWASGEPNNAGGSESCGVTNYNGAPGMWNDLNCSNENGYLVEFDTSASDFSTSVTTFDNITGEDVDAVPAPAEDEEPLADTGFDAALLLALALALIAAGSVVAVRARKN